MYSFVVWWVLCATVWLSVSLSVCLSVRTLTVAFLDRFLDVHSGPVLSKAEQNIIDSSPVNNLFIPKISLKNPPISLVTLLTNRQTNEQTGMKTLLPPTCGGGRYRQLREFSPGKQPVSWTASLGRAKSQVPWQSIVCRHWQPWLLIGRWSPAGHVTGRSSAYARRRSSPACAVRCWPISLFSRLDPTQHERHQPVSNYCHQRAFVVQNLTLNISWTYTLTLLLGYCWLWCWRPFFGSVWISWFSSVSLVLEWMSKWLVS